MATCNLSLKVMPRVRGGDKARTYAIVDKVLEYIRTTGLPYFTGPSETTIEGELDPLLDILRDAQRICVREGADQVFTIAHVSYREDGQSYQERLDRTVEHRESAGS